LLTSIVSSPSSVIIMPGPNNAKWGNGSHYCVITLTSSAIIMPGPNNAKWGNGSHYCVITLTAPSTPPPTGPLSPSLTPTPSTQTMSG
jgi:hypothetical protein